MVKTKPQTLTFIISAISKRAVRSVKSVHIVRALLHSVKLYPCKTKASTLKLVAPSVLDSKSCLQGQGPFSLLP